MRQAATKVIFGLSLAFSLFACLPAAAADLAGTIGQAGRLIEAKSYAQAATLLEDVLPDAATKDRRSILDLLRKAYDAMAREAKSAGNERAAAHFQENVAIIDQVRLAAQSEAKPKVSKPTPVNAPKPMTGKADGPSAAVATNAPAPVPAPLTPKSPFPRPVAPSSRLGLAAQQPSDGPPANPSPMPAKVASSQDSPQKPDLPSLQKPDASSPSATLPRSQESLASNDGSTSESDRSGAASIGSKARAQADSSDAARRQDDPKPKSPHVSLEDADRLFSAGRYEEAGKCYMALALQDHLPAPRKEHWAYCRMVAIARKINLRPQSAQEWDEIVSEITNIQRLSPNIWYGEYLRSKVAEVRRTPRRPSAPSENLVVRGSAPDETQDQPAAGPRRFPRLFGKSRAGTSAQPNLNQPAPAATDSAGTELPLKLPGAPLDGERQATLDGGQQAATPAPAAHEPLAPSQPLKDIAVNRAVGDAGIGPWQIHETTNFRIFHRDARLAEAAASAAEAVRARQAKRWVSLNPQRPWSPRCDIYLYASGKAFALETKQPEESPGFSTMTCEGSRVVARRVNLRADHPLLVTAILPHEVTHVVLADVFTSQQIPRWADEGIAVLAEPISEQDTRAAELREPLETGRVFDLDKLMAMDYPGPKDWSLYYAQSVSLTRFLVEQGPPERFVEFVQSSQRDGIDNALRRTYGFGGSAELQERWREYARKQLTELKEARRDPVSQREAIELK